MLKDKDLQKWIQNTTIEPSCFDEEYEIEEIMSLINVK